MEEKEINAGVRCCIVCGIALDHHVGLNRLTCSTLCREERQREKKRRNDAEKAAARQAERRCVVCGGLLPGNRKIVCSEHCASEQARVCWRGRMADPKRREKVNARRRAARKRLHRDPQWLAREHARNAQSRASKTAAISALRKMGWIDGYDVLAEPRPNGDQRVYQPKIRKRIVSGYWRKRRTPKVVQKKPNISRATRWLNISQLARQFGVSDKTIQRWAKAGIIPQPTRFNGSPNVYWRANIKANIPAPTYVWVSGWRYRRRASPNCIPQQHSKIVIVDSAGIARVVPKRWQKRKRESQAGRFRPQKRRRQILVAALREIGWLKPGGELVSPPTDGSN
jgi:predicted nucleic acid-binding Zn ribbon protein/predicted DNA-binding transcriptional regulator AlpA